MTAPHWLRRACRRLHIACLQVRLVQLLGQAQALALAHDAQAPLALGSVLARASTVRHRLADLQHQADIDRRVRAVLRRLP